MIDKEDTKLKRDVKALSKKINEWLQEMGYNDVHVIDATISVFGKDLDEITIYLKKE